MTGEQRSGLSLQLQQAGPIPLAAKLDCAAGEILALVGPSGSGKSSILRCIAGLLRPQSGSVRCNGEIWLDTVNGVDLPPRRRRVGMVFQNYALFPHMSAVENVMSAMTDVPPEQRLDQARVLLRRVHLDGLEDRRPALLSGGQQQRVAVARALARDPMALLLDEPFSAVDQVTRRKLHRELADLRRQWHMPVILVTHDLNEAAMLADRLCILHRGATLQSGPPQEVKSRPRNALVARLVDLQNVFEGVVREQRESPPLTLIEWPAGRLEVRRQPEFAAGTRVHWVVPPDNIILHRRDRPSRGERENPVAGVVAECLTLGEQISAVMHVAGRADLRLHLTMPAHVARRNRIGEGEPICVSLLAEGIHLMPWQPQTPKDAGAEEPAGI